MDQTKPEGVHAFIEPLVCERCGHEVGGIVRAGPEARTYGDPFDFAVVYIKKAAKAIIKALVSPEKNFSRHHYKAIYETVSNTGHTPDWERHKSSPQ